MGKKSGGAPAAPDPYKTAAAEAGFNRLDTYGSDGSGVRYGYTDAKGNFVQDMAPEGSQSAVQNVESPLQTTMREMFTGAAPAVAGGILGQNMGLLGIPGGGRMGGGKTGGPGGMAKPVKQPHKPISRRDPAPAPAPAQPQAETAAQRIMRLARSGGGSDNR